MKDINIIIRRAISMGLNGIGEVCDMAGEGLAIVYGAGFAVGSLAGTVLGCRGLRLVLIRITRGVEYEDGRC